MRRLTWIAFLFALGLQAGGRAPAQQEPEDPGPPKLKRGKPAPQKAPARKAAPAQPAATSTPPVAPPPAAEPKRTEPAPAPPPDPREALISRARQTAASFTEKLPNYMCQQLTTRYASQTNPPNWQAQDVVSAAVVYEDGQEDYRNITINGRPAAKSMKELPGTWSTGEFGTILSNLFSPATDPRFRYRNDSTASGLPAAVYDFDVAQPNSAWEVHAGAQMTLPAYRGALWIDKESVRVLRIEMQAVRLPDSFPFDSVETTVDYAFVSIGTQKYLLPARAENLSCQRGTSFCSRNVIDFRNYRKYSADSTIIFH